MFHFLLHCTLPPHFCFCLLTLPCAPLGSQVGGVCAEVLRFFKVTRLVRIVAKLREGLLARLSGTVSYLIQVHGLHSFQVSSQSPVGYSRGSLPPFPPEGESDSTTSYLNWSSVEDAVARVSVPSKEGAPLCDVQSPIFV
eukprot:3236742-Amphidinium_carterae.1